MKKSSGVSRPIIIDGDYTTIERRIIKEAFRALPKINPRNKSRHLSILSLNGWPIEVGYNDEKNQYSHFRRLGFNSIHSELHVIRKFLQGHYAGQLRQFDLFNVRINRYNRIVNSKPCRKCEYLLTNLFCPQRIFFTGEAGEFIQWQS